jgi:hypothetical protein
MQTKAVPTQYDPAGELVEKIALDLIRQYHTHLVNAKIAYLYINKDITVRGKKAVATAEKCGPKTKALSGYDFIVTIVYEKWNQLEDKQKYAILDHELCHCWVEDNDQTGETRFRILPHDFEDFGDVLKRHGLYSEPAKAIGKVVSTATETTSVVTDTEPKTTTK